MTDSASGAEAAQENLGWGGARAACAVPQNGHTREASPSGGDTDGKQNQANEGARGTGVPLHSTH